MLSQKAELQARLNRLPYDGTPEIKELSGKRYLYIRKRDFDRVKSAYVGEYNDAFAASGQRVDFDFEYSNHTNPKYMNVSLQFFRA